MIHIPVANKMHMCLLSHLIWAVSCTSYVERRDHMATQEHHCDIVRAVFVHCPGGSVALQSTAVILNLLESRSRGGKQASLQLFGFGFCAGGAVVLDLGVEVGDV